MFLKKNENYKEIPINLIYQDCKHKKDFRGIEYSNFCTIIKNYGQLFPIVTRKMPNNTYELIMGAKTLKAIQELGFKTAYTRVIEINDDEIEYLNKRTKVMKFKIKKKNKAAKKNVHIYKDKEILTNTLEQSANYLKKAGLKVSLIKKETPTQTEYKIRILKG